MYLDIWCTHTHHHSRKIASESNAKTTGREGIHWYLHEHNSAAPHQFAMIPILMRTIYYISKASSGYDLYVITMVNGWLHECEISRRFLCACNERSFITFLSMFVMRMIETKTISLRWWQCVNQQKQNAKGDERYKCRRTCECRCFWLLYQSQS